MSKCVQQVVFFFFFWVDSFDVGVHFFFLTGVLPKALSFYT